MANTADPQRRALLQALLGAPLLAGLPAARAAQEWPAWQVMTETSLSADGRVIDRSQADLRSTSEGQSYALFFALVDNDQALFDRLLAWTQNNLANGDLHARLPGWLWGRDDRGGWRLLDANPASDADLWLAYTLLEAARLWHRPALRHIAEGMLAQIREREIAALPGIGPMLLPGPEGFVEGDATRFNPSYLPLQLLRRFSTADRDGPWTALADNAVVLLRQAAPHGFAPDWAAWRDDRVIADPVKGATGSFDAIRCYLWAGMLSPRDRHFREQLRLLSGPLMRLRDGGPMWEDVDTRSGMGRGKGGYGFRAALLPYLLALDEPALARRQQSSLPTPAQQRADAPAYYAQMLVLFGTGWAEGRFRFAANGQLRPHWG